MPATCLVAACFDAPPRPSSSDVVDADVAEVVSACFAARGDDCARVTALALGARHSCALTADGALYCWGDRDYAQVGDRVIASWRPVGPSRIALPGPVREVALGWEHTCTLGLDDVVRCWGRNREGQVAWPPSVVVAEPKVIELPARPVHLAAAARTTCALLVDGEVSCWGARQHGAPVDITRVDDGLASAPEGVARLPGAAGVSAIRVGDAFACAWSSALAPPLGATATGDADVVRCWGDGDLGQLGGAADRAEPVALDVARRLDALALGGRHGCALADGALACWGDDRAAQLAGGAHAVEVLALGDTNGCIAAADGVRCWGRAQDGVLGSAATGSGPEPIAVVGVPPVDVLAIGRGHACAADARSVWCWGDGRDGQLDGGRADAVTATPRVVTVADDEGCVVDGLAVAPGGPHPSESCRVCSRGAFVGCSLGCTLGVCHAARDLAVHGERACVARDDGRLVCWDGGGSTVDGVSGVVEVELGPATTCVRDADRSVSCWSDGAPEVVAEDASAFGVGGFGVCTIVAGVVRCDGVAIAGLDAFGTMRAVAVGDDAACALAADGGAIYCWGDDAVAQLGRQAVELGAVETSGVVRYDDLAAGARHFVVTTETAVGGWGLNDVGQVTGAGSEPISGLVEAPALRQALPHPTRAVAAGPGTSCALSLGGQVRCWGDATVSSPRLARATLIAAGDVVCAVEAERALYCWRGDGALGQRVLP